MLEGRGSYELAIQAGLDGLARARELGLARQAAVPIAGNPAESLVAAGRWDEALETLDEVLGLTVRELEVLRLVAARRGNREIAASLFISPRTASVHVSNILSKLSVSSRGEATATAHRLHLFD